MPPWAVGVSMRWPLGLLLLFAAGAWGEIRYGYTKAPQNEDNMCTAPYGGKVGYYLNEPVPTVELNCDPEPAFSNSAPSCIDLVKTLAPNMHRPYTIDDSALQVTGLTNLENYDANQMYRWGSGKANQDLSCNNWYYGCMKTIVCDMKVTATRTCTGGSDLNQIEASAVQQCRMCTHATCPHTIPNGHWAGPITTYKDIFPNIYNVLSPAIPGIVPQPCAPGTWLTCTANPIAQGCSYPAPARGQNLLSWLQDVATFSRTDTIWAGTEMGFPNGGCYKCPTAAGKSHYGETMLTVTPQYQSLGMLPFYCPGGADPPRLCVDDQTGPHGVYVDKDQNTGKCQCMPGWYPQLPDKPEGQCLPCGKGYFCHIDEADPTHPTVRTLCPDGYYQDQIGQTVCKPCDQTVCDAPGYARTACATPKPGVGKTVSENFYKTANAQCVRCSQCDEIDTANGRPCLDVLSVQALKS